MRLMTAEFKRHLISPNLGLPTLIVASFLGLLMGSVVGYSGVRPSVWVAIALVLALSPLMVGGLSDEHPELDILEGPDNFTILGYFGVTLGVGLPIVLVMAYGIFPLMAYLF